MREKEEAVGLRAGHNAVREWEDEVRVVVRAKVARVSVHDRVGVPALHGHEEREQQSREGWHWPIGKHLL